MRRAAETKSTGRALKLSYAHIRRIAARDQAARLPRIDRTASMHGIEEAGHGIDRGGSGRYEPTVHLNRAIGASGTPNRHLDDAARGRFPRTFLDEADGRVTGLLQANAKDFFSRRPDAFSRRPQGLAHDRRRLLRNLGMPEKDPIPLPGADTSIVSPEHALIGPRRSSSMRFTPVRFLIAYRFARTQVARSSRRPYPSVFMRSFSNGAEEVSVPRCRA